MESTDLILAYSRDPVGFVPMDDATVSYHQDNTVCGDFIEVFVKVDDQHIVTGFSYQGSPAMHTIAAASLLAEYIVGTSVQEVLTRDYTTIEGRGLSVSTRRQRSAVTALLATKNALHDWLQDGKEEMYEELLEKT